MEKGVGKERAIEIERGDEETEGGGGGGGGGHLPSLKKRFLSDINAGRSFLEGSSSSSPS